MKNAPNVKTLPKDKMEEAIIFAGTGAWKAAKAYQTEQGEGGDAIPPVVLDHTQLTELPHLRIVDKGRRFARVYQAGLIEQNHISMIANKLQEAGVTNAEYINEKGEKEDWTALMSRIEKQPLTVVDRGGATLHLTRWGPASAVKYCWRTIVANWRFMPISDMVHHYNGVIWNPLPDKELQRVLAQIYIDSETSYSQNAIKSSVETMKLSLPVMGVTARNLIGFSNGVFDTRTGPIQGGMIRPTGC